MKSRLFLFLLCCHFSLFAQTDKELASSKVEEAAELMELGKLDESLHLFKESEKLDPKNQDHSFEIGYIYALKEDFNKAIRILKKLKNKKNIDSRVYQVLGNSYSFSGRFEKAIKTYEEGIRKFPNAGNLYLEKGNVFLYHQLYQKAIENYEKGTEVDPYFSFNYYRLAELYLNGNDKLSGLIYGELFMNLEKGSMRTREMSEMLFDAYRTILNPKDKEVKFCKNDLDLTLLEEDGFKLPFLCGC